MSRTKTFITVLSLSSLRKNVFMGSPAVLLQMLTLSKTQLADQTDIGPFAGVCSNVLIEVTLFIEVFTTKLTHVFLLSCLTYIIQAVATLV